MTMMSSKTDGIDLLSKIQYTSQSCSPIPCSAKSVFPINCIIDCSSFSFKGYYAVMELIINKRYCSWSGLHVVA